MVLRRVVGAAPIRPITIGQPLSILQSIPRIGASNVRSISSIPFHPGLVLGQFVDPTLLDYVEKKAAINVPVDVLHDGVTELFNTRRSLDLTLQELAAMKIAASDEMLKAKSELDQNIQKRVGELATARFKAVQASLALSAPAMVRDSIESPVNFAASEIKQLPLSSDSLKLDTQYFKYESNSESKGDYVNKVKAYVAGQVSGLGNTVSTAAGSSAEKQVSRQLNANNLEGTLIISCVCTHQNAKMLSPMKLDVEKCIEAWNELNAKDPIKMPEDAAKIEAQGTKTAGSKPLKLLTGVTTGSSFIGLVHLLKSERSMSSQDVAATASRAEVMFKQSLFFASRSGGFGVDKSSAASIKSLFSSNEIQCHVTVQVMGAIPTIQAGEGLRTVLKTMGDADTMGDLLKMQNANTGEGGMQSMTSAGQRAIAGEQVAQLAASQMESAITAVTTIDGHKDQMFDIGTLVTAFTNYVSKVSEGDCGVPINFYTKSISKYAIARMWKDKYFPDDFIKTPYQES